MRAFAIDHSCAVHKQEAVGARELVLLLGLHRLRVAGSRQRLLRGALGFVVVISFISIVTSPTGVAIAGSAFAGWLVWETLKRLKEEH